MGQKKTHELLLQTTPPFSHPAPPNFKIITNYPFQIIPSSSSSLFNSTTNELLLCNHEIPPPTQLWTPRGSSSSSFAFNSTSFLSISLFYVAILFHEGDNRSVIHVQLYNSSEIVNVMVPFFGSTSGSCLYLYLGISNSYIKVTFEFILIHWHFSWSK